METSAPPASVHCRPGRRATDRRRFALVLDYRGDAPPTALLNRLTGAGWLVPAVLPPPSGSIDWNRPDPSSGRDWSVRPYNVRGAVAVPGPTVKPDCTTVSWLEETLGSLGITLDPQPEGVLSLDRPSPGLGQIIDEPAAEVAGRDRLVVKPLPDAPIHVGRRPTGIDLRVPSPAPATSPAQPREPAAAISHAEPSIPRPMAPAGGPASTRSAQRIDGPLVWDRSLTGAW